MNVNNILCVISIGILTGCSTYSLRPEAQQDAYAIHVLSINAPQPMPAPVSVKELINQPQAEVYEFPVMYCAIGSSVTNNQLYDIETPLEMDESEDTSFADFDERTGSFYKIKLLNTDGSNITYLTYIQHEIFMKFVPYEIDDRETVLVPYVEGGQMFSEVTQPLDKWKVIEGYVADSEGTVKHTKHYFCIRIVSPKEKNISQKSFSCVEESSWKMPYRSSFTLFSDAQLSPLEAIENAKKFIRDNEYANVDVESATVLYETLYNWIIQFDLQQLERRGLPSTMCIPVNKKTGKARSEGITQ